MMKFRERYFCLSYYKMKNYQKILIGILFTLLTAGRTEETQKLEFEYKADEQIKKVFADNKIFLSDDAKIYMS